MSISEGYQLLAAKQGVDDQRFMSIQVSLSLPGPNHSIAGHPALLQA